MAEQTATVAILAHPRIGRDPDATIAADVGCSAPLVCMVRWEHGIPAAPRRSRRRPEAAAAYALRDVLGLSWAEVAARTGYPTATAAHMAALRYQRAAGRPVLTMDADRDR